MSHSENVVPGLVVPGLVVPGLVVLGFVVLGLVVLGLVVPGSVGVPKCTLQLYLGSYSSLIKYFTFSANSTGTPTRRNYKTG
jgi:GLTT repeat (6 copies)